MPSTLHIKMDFVSPNNITSLMDAAYQIQKFFGADRNPEQHEWYIVHVYEDVANVVCNVYVSRQFEVDMDFTRQVKARMHGVAETSKSYRDYLTQLAIYSNKYIATTLEEIISPQTKQQPTMETSKQMGITTHVMSVSTINKQAEVIESVTLSKDSANFIATMAQHFLHEMLLNTEPTMMLEAMITPLKDVKSILSSLQTSFTIETGVCISCIRVLEKLAKLCAENFMVTQHDNMKDLQTTKHSLYGNEGQLYTFGDQDKQVITHYNSATRDSMLRLANELRNSLLFIQPYKF
jgi:hypothetical protein